MDLLYEKQLMRGSPGRTFASHRPLLAQNPDSTLACFSLVWSIRQCQAGIFLLQVTESTTQPALDTFFKKRIILCYIRGKPRKNYVSR